MNKKNLVLIISVIFAIGLACSEGGNGGNNFLADAAAVSKKKDGNAEKFNKALDGMREALEKADSIEEFTKENESLHKEALALAEEGEKLSSELVRLYDEALKLDHPDAMLQYLQAVSEFWKKSLEQDKLTTAHLKSTWGRWDETAEENKVFQEKKDALEREKVQLQERFIKIVKENPDVFGEVNLDQ